MECWRTGGCRRETDIAYGGRHQESWALSLVPSARKRSPGVHSTAVPIGFRLPKGGVTSVAVPILGTGVPAAAAVPIGFRKPRGGVCGGSHGDVVVVDDDDDDDDDGKPKAVPTSTDRESWWCIQGTQEM